MGITGWLFVVLIVMVGVWYRVHANRQKAALTGLEERAAETADRMRAIQGEQTTSAAETGEVPPIAEEPKALTALDAPMIQARVTKLGLLKGGYDAEQLKRTILDACQQGRVGLWWLPLQEFSKVGGSRAGITVVDAAATDFAGLKRMQEALGKGMVDTNVKLDRLVDANGATLGAAPGRGGEILLAWEWGSKSGAMPLKIVDSKLDVQALVRSLNGLLASARLPHRLLLPAPSEDLWCTLLCDPDAAERAASARWGQLLLPPG